MLTLVLLPGMDGTGSLFEPFIEEARQHFNIKVVSYPTSEALGYDALEQIALQCLPRTEPFLLLGESFSGPIAISIAASQPPGLVGLILCSTFASNPRPKLSALRFFAKSVPPKLAPVGILSYMLLGSYSTEKLNRSVARAVAQVSSAAFNARLQAVQSVNVLSKLKNITVPVLYLQAGNDRVIPKTAAKQIQEMLPSVEVLPVAAPHCLLQTVPTEATRIIQSFANKQL